MPMKSMSIRIDNNLLNKFHIVADYEERSTNGQTLVLIKQCIEEFEEKHGKIELGTSDTQNQQSKTDEATGA